MDYESLTNEELIDIARAGDEWAEHVFFEKNMALLKSIAGLFIFNKNYYNREHYHDFVSAAQLGMLSAYKTFDPTKGVPFAPYATHCMKNEIKKVLRTYSKNNKLEKESFDFDVESNTLDDLMFKVHDTKEADTDTLIVIKDTIHNFYSEATEREKEVFDLVVLNEYSYKPASEILGMSKSRLGRIVLQIREKYFNDLRFMLVN